MRESIEELLSALLESVKRFPNDGYAEERDSDDYVASQRWNARPIWPIRVAIYLCWELPSGAIRNASFSVKEFFRKSPLPAIAIGGLTVLTAQQEANQEVEKAPMSPQESLIMESDGWASNITAKRAIEVKSFERE